MFGIIGKSFIGYIIDFIKPETCPICGIRIASFPSIICEKCGYDIDVERRISHVQIVSDDRHRYIDESITLFTYESARKLILTAKYSKRNEVLRYAGDHLGKWLLARGMEIDAVTYVPMRYGKMIRRGENPSKLLAVRIATKIGVDVKRILRERTVRGEQKLKSREGRFVEIIGRFYGLKRNAKGKTVVLVDDVMTTGATLNECGRILKGMGAERIISVTIAEVSTKTLEKK